ncbi:MAG TPA: ABC transporter permease [Bryobacteraceae bacterium]|nr:ABC transporter permease [Bryobacteraceae bacterium]
MNWQRFFKREQADADLRQELESYLEITTSEYVARGMNPDAARAAARRKLGNRTLLREEIYYMNTIPILESLSTALRYWCRTLRREPVFTAAATLTLALGIGATTAIFSVVNGVLIKPLPYPAADQLLSVSHFAPGMGFETPVGMSPSMLFTYREEGRVFQSIGGWSPDAATVTDLAEPQRVRALLITFGTLQALNVPPLTGRWLSQEEDTEGSPEVVLLSYGYWQRQFGGDPNIVGRAITVDSRPRQIIGVMPPSFFRLMGQDPDLFIPLRLDRNRLHLGDLGFLGIARLKPGVSLAQANSDVARMLPIWLQSWPGPNARFGREVFEKARFSPALRPLKDDVVGDIGKSLWLVMGAVGLILLIACANVANLLLVRAESRQHERGVRMALGAGRAQIAQESLAESLLLGAAGGLFGLGLAYRGIRLLRLMNPRDLPRLQEISIDASVLLFALAASLLSCLLFGLLPALKFAGSHLGPALRLAGRSAGTSRDRHRAQNVLLAGQISLALVLLVMSGLMLRTFQETRKVRPGFTNPEQVQVFSLAIPGSQVAQPERVVQIWSEIIKDLAAIPGVSAAGLANSLPMDDTKNLNPILAENSSTEPGTNPPVRTFKFVSPGFLAATGTRTIAGRDLVWDDIYNHRSVVLVSENLARELWGSSTAAVGKRIREMGNEIRWREVVGVVENVHDDGIQKQPPPIVYWLFATANFNGAPLNVQRNVAFAVRSHAAGTEAFLKQVRQVVAAVSPTSPVVRPRTLQEIYGDSMAQTSFALVMLAIAGGMALVLGVIGVYGVIAYTVEQRRREVGIRMALGAPAAAVKRIFLLRGLLLACAGITLGLAAAASFLRLMSSLLFGVTWFDPATYGAAATALLAAAMAATYLPARRAASVDPMEILRGE